MRRLSVLGRWLVLVPLTAIAVTACGGSGGSTTTTASGGSLALPVSLVRFAEFTSVPLLDPDTPAYAGPATPHSLDGVQIVPTVAKELAKPGVSEALAQQGFVVVPADFSLFQFAYQGNDYEGWPVFVTADAAYNTWHLVFDKLLRTLEQEVLLPKLETLLAGLVRDAHRQTVELAGSTLADPALRVEQLFEAAAAELGANVRLGPLARQEKALIDAHSATETSPLVGTKVDYSLFVPRGHYTLNADLKRFFVAMSVLGQLPFCLPGTLDCNGLEPARTAILAARVLDTDSDLVKLWHDIYDPTAFLVGLSDDYTPFEVADAAQAATPDGLYGDAKVFANDATVRNVIDALIAARPVRINPERASIRVMGTRFVLDSYLLDQLVYPNVGTADKPRLVPSALDLASAFGSKLAEQTLAQTGASAFANFDSQLEAVRAAVASRAPEDWGSTVYDAWLSAIEPMFAAHGKAFPDFMRSDAWAAKDLQSGFGSYTELKHDTILLAKQVLAEGGDEPSKDHPRNWVEPDPAAFGRLAAAADLMQQGLLRRGLLTAQQAGLLSTEVDLFRFFERIAQEEVAGTPLTAADNNRLRYIGGELEALWWRTSTQTGNVTSDPDAAAVIADIASSAKGVLELGTGRIDRIYVLVPGNNGKFEVALGGVYSFYEFTNPPGERLTDAEWHALLDSGKAPARPAWEKAFLTG